MLDPDQTFGGISVSISKSIVAVAAGAVAFVGGSSGAVAASTPVAAVPPATGRALVLVPLRFTKVDDLDFGSLIPSGASGTVTINAITGVRTVSGGVTGIPSAIGKRAMLAGAGSGGQRVIIDMTPPAQLTSIAGDTINVLGLNLDGSVVRTINPVSKTFFVGVGGSLLIGANQPEGVYSSTFDITAEYL